MATTKSTRSRKRRKAVPKAVSTTRKAVPATQFRRFPEVKGKPVESVQINPDVEAICIAFQDKTMLSFDFDPGLTVCPELSNHKTGESWPIKRWPAMHSRISMVKWP